jgi:hypothetical protein
MVAGMTDPIADAVDRLDRLHATWPMPTTCTQCERHGTTAADRICGPCAYERRLRQIWSA